VTSLKHKRRSWCARFPIWRRKPDWALLGSPDISHLPAIRWKLINLGLLQTKQPEKYRAMIQDLEAMLSNG